jgi:tetratricopeptide (TPR) repeat protein
MSIDTVRIEEITHLLNDWYHEIRSRNLITSEKMRQEVEQKLQTVDVHQFPDLYIQYWLFEYRYFLLVEDFKQADKILTKIEPKRITHSILDFHYHFFKAIHNTLNENYSEARKYFEEAKKQLKWVSEPIEKGEFYYKVAEYYYHIEQPLLAVHNASIAKKTFNLDGYEIKQAGCENILGLSCILLKQYEQAEDYLLAGLDLVLKQKEESLSLLFRYNLGLLYSEQNLSLVAINHLNEAYDKKFRPHKTAFLLAREHYKLEQRNEAELLIEQGLGHCSELENSEYKYHLTLLRMFHNDFSETVFSEGITYFEREELWGYVQEYCEKAALTFLSMNQHDRACNCFFSAYKAKQKLVEKGLLK